MKAKPFPNPYEKTAKDDKEDKKGAKGADSKAFVPFGKKK